MGNKRTGISSKSLILLSAPTLLTGMNNQVQRELSELNAHALNADEGALVPVSVGVDNTDYRFGRQYAERQRVSNTNSANGFNDILRDSTTSVNQPLYVS